MTIRIEKPEFLFREQLNAVDSNIPVLMFLLILSGMLGSARLYLRAHNHLQVYVGFLLGCIVEFAGLFFLI